MQNKQVQENGCNPDGSDPKVNVPERLDLGSLLCVLIAWRQRERSDGRGWRFRPSLTCLRRELTANPVLGQLACWRRFTMAYCEHLVVKP
jgi:hypothetical protein